MTHACGHLIILPSFDQWNRLDYNRIKVMLGYYIIQPRWWSMQLKKLYIIIPNWTWSITCNLNKAMYLWHLFLYHYVWKLKESHTHYHDPTYNACKTIWTPEKLKQTVKGSIQETRIFCLSLMFQKLFIRLCHTKQNTPQEAKNSVLYIS